MQKLRLVYALAAAVSLLVVSTSYAQGNKFTRLTSLPPPAEAAVLIYDPDSGNYSMRAGESVRIVSWEHKSTGSMFIPEGLRETDPPTKLVGLFDVLTEAKLFKLDPVGFSDIDFGPILPARLSFDDINDDAEVSGSLITSDPCTILNHCTDPNSPYLYMVPEPSSLVPFLIGALAIVRWRRS